MKGKIPRAAMLVLVFACLSGGREAWTEQKDVVKISPSHVYEVPTTGKILDIDYRPEFDEWWVKCREGADVAVYSYDRATKKWSKVVFTLGKPKPKKPEKDVQLEKPKVVPDIRKEAPKEEQPPAPETPEPEAKGIKPAEVKPPEVTSDQAPPTKDEAGKRRWWNPLEILKKGEKILRTPLSPEPAGKKQAPNGRKIEY